MLYHCLIILLLALPILFQEKAVQTKIHTAIYGTVYDQDGTPVRAVTVSVGKLATNTYDDGKFFLEGVPSGETVVEFKKPGFETAKRSLFIKRGETVHVDITSFKKSISSKSYQNLLGLPVQQITKSGVNLFASSSPDRERLAVEVLDKSTFGFDIWILSSNGQKILLLTHLADDESNPHWSPSGETIIFSSFSYKNGYRIWTVTSSVKRSPVFVDKGITPSWSSDGQWIVYAKGDTGGRWNIWKMDLATKEAVRLTKDDAKAQYPVWEILNGEERIIYASTKESKSDEYEIWSMKVNGSDQKRLTTSGKNLVGPTISPDGKRIACWSLKRGKKSSVWLMDFDGSNLTEVLTDAGNPQWFDEKTLLVNSQRTGQSQIWKTFIR